MKAIGASALSIIISLAAATGSATASQRDPNSPSADSMCDTMHGSMAEMTPGMPMTSGGQMLGRERPLLSLALRNRTELGLSDAQASGLKTLVDRFGEEAKERLRAIETAERELADLLKQEPTDLGQVDGKLRAIEKLRADLRLRRIQTIADGRALLTPEQRAKLDQLVGGHGGSARGGGSRGVEEMHRFMHSERMPQAMSAMMAMAERMGDGDMMLGMVRMMEMMSMMGGGGMMAHPERSQPPSEDEK